MNNESYLGRWFKTNANSSYMIHVCNRISSNIYLCVIYKDNILSHIYEVHDTTIITNILTDVWEDITGEIEGKGN